MEAFRNDPAIERHTKGRRTRVVPLSEAALVELQRAERRRLAGSRWVFAHRCVNRGAKRGDRIESLYRSFVRVATSCGLPDAHPHALRHSFVTRKLAAGVPPQLVQAYLGHRHIATRLRYTHLVPEHLRTVVA